MIVAGVDCGKSGAVALVRRTEGDVRDLLGLRDMPLLGDGTLDAHTLLTWLVEADATDLVVEYCFRPSSLVWMAGGVVAVAKVAGVAAHVVAARTWQKAVFGAGDSDKARSCALAAELFPGATLTRGKRGKKADHNRAEALLLAHYLLTT